MAVTPRIEIKQSQSLLMTAQLRQAIGLLQLNNLELTELVEQELQSNPLLEREDDRMADAETGEQTINDYNAEQTSDTENFAPDIDEDNAFDDYGSDREGYEPSWDAQLSGKGKDTDEDFDFLSQKAARPQSVYELLDSQISGRFTTARNRLIASRLCSFLDGAGYFTGNLEQISAQTHIALPNLRKILSVLQTFEPSGIFATNLKECLSAQLRDANRLDTMMLIFLEHLDLLAARNFKALKKLCHAEDDDLASMIADIKALNPKPLANYQTDGNSYIVPDVFVRRGKYGDYTVELNQDTLPRVLINREYIDTLRFSAKAKTEKKYLKEQLSGANFLVKALHQRAETILRISTEIVKRQHDFFEYGIDHIRPMLLRDVAEAVEMHESTVSRATAHKYLHAPCGTFELKYFFSAKAGMYNGDEQTSTTRIKHLLKQLIDHEGDHILSDDALVEKLAAQSIKIARRTVAKYRDEMGIPTSAQRKRSRRERQI